MIHQKMNSQVKQYLQQYYDIYDSKIIFDNDYKFIKDIFAKKNTCQSRIVIVGDNIERDLKVNNGSIIDDSLILLDKILHSINLKKNKVFFLDSHNQCNDKRSLKNQLSFISPRLIIVLGKAVKFFFDGKDDLNELRNKIHHYESSDLIVTFHPADLLKKPRLKRDTWEDFKFIRDKYLNGK